MSSRFSFGIVVSLALVAGITACGAGIPSGEFREGDILFQTSRSAQSQAIQSATHSRWSHMGVLVLDRGKLRVLEAVQPVRMTPLDEWIARGKGGEVVVKRLTDADKILSPPVLDQMRRIGHGFLGRGYDLTFEWSDQRLYCSELVWKLYDRGAGVQLSTLHHLSDFDFSAPAVQKVMRQRYGAHLPLEEPVVSPEDIFESSRLRTVWSNVGGR
jgi:hypothetical protein